MSYDPTLQDMRLRHLHSQPDEGYSEEVHSQAGSELSDLRERALSEAAKITLRSLETLAPDDKLDVLRYATSSFSQADQLALLKDILFSLPTWAKQEVSSHLDSLMFFDPVQYFPYEIIQTIFASLSPKDLLNASAVNHAWRLHTQDEELWRACFKREGWLVDAARLRAVELTAREKAARHSGPVESVMDQSLNRRDSRKRRRAEAFNESDAMNTDVDDQDEHMEGSDTATFATARSAHHSSPTSTASPVASKGKGRLRRYSTQSTHSMRSSASVIDTGFRLKPTLMQADTSDGLRVSWAYLYKQRRILERNWENGTYQQFRLPHPKYEYEGHAECVYTIQHIGTTLVSGSRDRTIRRWDLETCRLKGQPLRGHDASVLCLQFDPTPENDLIVSGGSDSWVIIWRYSTGEIIKKMTTAHTESVLNLRFDDRYIVTCSKDKTIKIWNRRAISSADPLMPTHVLPQDPLAGPFIIEEYSLLTQLLGHHAAVNAVMIHADFIVSASGDRHIKAWNIHSGRCERTYTGHTKGIACVQYDGRRIISGSSDNTVRIFDADQQAEVACLHGHSNLVRTVQARFGDLEVTSAEELHDEAKRADVKWARAMAMGASPASGSRRSLRNAGSSRPEDMLTIGAKVPPGGGGTKWARIVSGSYDETVIIWKKDHDGKWVAKHKLHQDMLLKSRWRPVRPFPQVTAHQMQALAAQGPLTQQNLQQLAQAQARSSPNQQNPRAADADGQPSTPQPPNASREQEPASSQAATNGSSSVQTHRLPETRTTTVTQQGEPQIHHQLHHHHHHHHHHHAQSSAAASPSSNVTTTAVTTTTNDTVAAPPAQQATQQQQQQAQQRMATLGMGMAHHMHEHGHSARLDSNRIFKLQFDVRRIVCCSQNKVIVGWDFAAGNEELGKVGNWCEETY